MTLPKSANLAAAEQSTNDKAAPASCPLSAPCLQLIPVRYAYVENLAYVKSGNQDKAVHPIGIRLLRDGWLYVADAKLNSISEHVLKDGLITATRIRAQDQQANSLQSSNQQDIDNQKKLVFSKDHNIYISYSQIEWNEEKCKQMLKQQERNMFMQEIDLSNVSCENLPDHLLTRDQAENYIAEVAEQYPAPDYEVEFEEEKTAYSWTCSEFTPTGIGTLTQTLGKEYEKQGNYLFVIVEDYLGMMLDLVREQRVVANWLGDWSEKDNNSLKYNVGAYIESTLTVTLNNASQKGASAWIEGLPADQQQTLYDYVNEKIAFEKASESYYDVDPDYSEDIIRSAPYYAHEKVVEAKRQRIINQQGIETYQIHQEEIENLVKNQKEHLDGKLFGGRGINQLVETDKVKQYFEHERPKYTRWQEHLELITKARSKLYTTHFFMSTWYYSAEQKQALLELEDEVMSDLFRNEDAIKHFSEFLETKPYYHYPAIQSNFDYTYIAETLPSIVEWFAKTSNYVEATTNQTAPPIQQLEELIGRDYWSQLFSETGRIQELQQMRALNLTAAVNQSLNTFMRTLSGPMLNAGGLQRFDSALARYTNLAQQLSINARAAFLFEIRQIGFVYLTDNPLNMANTQRALNTINNNLSEIDNNRQALDRLLRDRANLRNFMSNQSKGLSTVERNREISRISREIVRREKEITRRENTISQNQTRLAELISPLREGEGHASIRFRLNAEQQAAINFERNALSAGVRTAYGQGSAGFARAANSTRLPMFLFVFSVYNMNTALNTYYEEKNYSVEERMPLLSSLSTTIAAALSVWQTAHIALLEHVVVQMNAQHANLVGARLLSRMGRLNILLGGLGQIFSGLSSYFSLYTNFSKWYAAILKGDTGLAISAATALTAAAGNSAIGTYGLYHTVTTGARVYREIRAGQLTARAVWAVRGAQFATALGRVTPVGIVLTVLQIAGEFGVNYFNTSELQDWFHYSCWGRSNKGWDQAQHNQQLADALLKPVIVDLGVVQKQGKSYRKLRVHCVGQIKNGLQSHPVKWQAAWVGANKEDNIAEQLKHATYLTDETYPYVAFDWLIPWLDKTQWKDYVHGNVLNLRLFYTPDLATKPLGGDNGIGYKIALKTWDKPTKPYIKQVAGDKVLVAKQSHLAIYQGDVHE